MKVETPAVSASGSEASEQCIVAPEAVVEAVEPVKEVDPMALDNFALSPQVKVLLRKKGIESLFPIQVSFLSYSCGFSMYTVTALMGAALDIAPCPLHFCISAEASFCVKSVESTAVCIQPRT